MWRPEDEALLGRLEDELVLERLYRHHVGPHAQGTLPHLRAAGLVALARRVDGGESAVAEALAGDVSKLARLVEAAPLKERPPPFLHHLALYFGRVASVLESHAPEAAANAWMRSLGAWLALGEEKIYLAQLEAAVSGAETRRGQGLKEKAALLLPAMVPLEIVDDLGRRAERAARDLGAAGKAALLALAWIGEAARLAGASVETTKRAQRAAERGRNAALDAALAVIGEALDEANLRGELSTAGRPILLRALQVWSWSAEDAAVEEFVVDRLATVGWQLYRARSWDALRHTFDPFRPLIEHFAQRVEADPSRIAFAAPCAQMFVFLTDIEKTATRKSELAERAVRICPTHRNGRLNLAALLCEQAILAMRAMMLFARREELDRIEAQLARAESLYPESAELPEARAALDRLKRGRIAL